MNNKPILDVKNLKVHFKLKGSFLRDMRKRGDLVRAVDGVTFQINENEILSLVGESGSGKTTTGKAILQLVDSESETLLFDGKPILKHDKRYMKQFRQTAQMIFHDPYQSLNPRNRILDIVAEPLDVNRLALTEEERTQRVKDALEYAGLIPGEDFFYRYPYELSGGQRQRVVIAGAMIMNPRFIVADEPVSMLDASIRISVLKLMLDMRETHRLSYMFITHDLSLAWLISDRIAIMYLGRIMEIGGADDIIHRGLHPYTKALTHIMPKPGEKKKGEYQILKGETPNPADIITGCKFYSRCPEAQGLCADAAPEMTEVAKGHFVACHFI
jgi:oligopeptide/dipeptide ABC transporter ATP-binding protein